MAVLVFRCSRQSKAKVFTSEGGRKDEGSSVPLAELGGPLASPPVPGEPVKNAMLHPQSRASGTPEFGALDPKAAGAPMADAETPVTRVHYIGGGEE